MKTLSYKIEPISMRIPFDVYIKMYAKDINSYFGILSEYIESHLDPIPDYAERVITVRKVSLSRGCFDAMVTFEEAVTVDEDKFRKEIEEIVTRNGLEIYEIRSGYEVDTAFYEVVLQSEFDLIFSESSLKKEQAIMREIHEGYKSLGLMFKIHS